MAAVAATVLSWVTRKVLGEPKPVRLSRTWGGSKVGEGCVGPPPPEDSKKGTPQQQRCPQIPFKTPVAHLDEAMVVFKTLLRFDTSNPPGQERECADWCIAQLRTAGVTDIKVFDATTDECAPGSLRRSVIARLPGKAPESEDLMLSSHLDVVPAECESWTSDPFDADERDDAHGTQCVWGRGAVDMKHFAAQSLVAFLELARAVNGVSGTPIVLERGIKLVLVADEEAGCTHGSLAMVRQHPEWFVGKAATCLTEAGAITAWMGGKPHYMLQVAEKGFAWLKLKIKGRPGHGSTPHGQDALSLMAPLLSSIVEKPFFEHAVCDHGAAAGSLESGSLGGGSVARCFDELGSALGGGVTGWLMRQVANPSIGDFVLANIVSDQGDTLRCLTHHTAAATMCEAGVKTNILPPRASLTVDCRIVPGVSPEQFLQEFRERFEGSYEIEPIQLGAPVENEHRGNAIFALCEEVISAAHPGATCLPWVIQGFTDARAFAEVGIPTFGFSPLWCPPSLPFADLGFHGHDEHVPSEGFRWGAACVREVVRRYCVIGAAANPAPAP